VDAKDGSGWLMLRKRHRDHGRFCGLPCHLVVPGRAGRLHCR